MTTKVQSFSSLEPLVILTISSDKLFSKEQLHTEFVLGPSNIYHDSFPKEPSN